MQNAGTLPKTLRLALAGTGREDLLQKVNLPGEVVHRTAGEEEAVHPVVGVVRVSSGCHDVMVVLCAQITGLTIVLGSQTGMQSA